MKGRKSCGGGHGSGERANGVEPDPGLGDRLPVKGRAGRTADHRRDESESSSAPVVTAMPTLTVTVPTKTATGSRGSRGVPSQGGPPGDGGDGHQGGAPGDRRRGTGNGGGPSGNGSDDGRDDRGGSKPGRGSGKMPDGSGGPPSEGGDDDDEETSSSSSRVSRVTIRARDMDRLIASKRNREADEIKILPLPTGPQYRAWRSTVLQSVNAASGRPGDRALHWALAATDEDVPDESPKRSGEFETLDLKWAAALQKVAHGELGRKMQQAADNALKERRSVRGRELFRIIAKYYKTNAKSDFVFGFNDLKDLEVHGSRLGEFLDNWEMVLSGMRNPPAENVLEDLLYGKIHRFDGLAEDIAHYNRLDDDAGGDRSYEFLLSSAQRCANRERQKNMREQMSRALRNNLNLLKAVPAADGAAREETRAAPAVEGAGAGTGSGKGQTRGEDAHGWALQVVEALKGKGFGKGKDKGKGKTSGTCWWYPLGLCTSGDDCRFEHEDGDAAPTRAAADDVDKTRKPCEFHDKGKCKLGASCKFDHGPVAEKSPAEAARQKAKAKAACARSLVPPSSSRGAASASCTDPGPGDRLPEEGETDGADGMPGSDDDGRASAMASRKALRLRADEFEAEHRERLST